MIVSGTALMAFTITGYGRVPVGPFSIWISTADYTALVRKNFFSGLVASGYITNFNASEGIATTYPLAGIGTGSDPLRMPAFPPCPPFNLTTLTLYARPANEGGNDQTGTGTFAKPFKTLTKLICAVQDLYPSNSLPPDLRIDLDITNVSESLPADYKLPAWKCSDVIEADVGSEFFAYICGVNISAEPRLMSSISAFNATVQPGDVLPTTADPVTGQLTYTLTGIGAGGAARASWNNNALKGKLAVGLDNTVYSIHASTSTSFSVTGRFDFAGVIRIMEPSAHLVVSQTESFNGGISAFNCDSIAFRGIKITSQDGGYGLAMGGTSIAVMMCCELENPFIEADSIQFSRVGRCWIYGMPAFTGNMFLINNFMENCIDPLSSSPPGTVITRSCVYDSCAPIGFSDFVPAVPFVLAATAPTTSIIYAVQVRNGVSHGVVFGGGCGLFEKVNITGCAGDGIRAERGSGVLELNGVRTNGLANLGEGLVVKDGIQVHADAVTSAAAVGANKPLAGVSGLGMKVGDRPFRTWANYLSTVPIKDERDLTTVAGLGGSFDNDAAADSYVIGSGSRVYE